MVGEITMLQLYGVALTAGKAHRDHKHHHAHHFEHSTNNNVPLTTTTNVPITGIPFSTNPYLTGGQLNHQVKINPGAHIQIIQNGITLRHPKLPLPSEVSQPLSPAILSTQSTDNSNINSLQTKLPIMDFNKKVIRIGDIGTRVSDTSFLSMESIKNSNMNGYSLIDRQYRDIITDNIDGLSKNEKNQQTNGDEIDDDQSIDHIEFKKISKRESLHNIMKGKQNKDKKNFKKVQAGIRSRRSTNYTLNIISLNKKKQKRGLVFSDGFVIDNSYIHQIPQQLHIKNNYYKGLTNFGPTSVIDQRQKNKEEEREPAEEEVRRVMNICNGCADEPFEKAIVISWRTVPKKLYSGAVHIPAIQVCKAF